MVPANHEHLVVSGMVADESLQKSANLAESGAQNMHAAQRIAYLSLRKHRYFTFDVPIG
jgi:hypothetical protein